MQKKNVITLIALIIAIVTLLAFAGITVSTLTGKNRLLARAIDEKNVSDSQDVSFSYDIKDVTKEDGKVIWKILISFQSSEKIAKVEYGEQILTSYGGVEKIAVDFEVENKVEYVFKVTTIAGKEVDKTSIIDKEIMTGIELNKTNIE